MDTEAEPTLVPVAPVTTPAIAHAVPPPSSAIQTPPCKHVAVAESTPTPVSQPGGSEGVKISKWLIAGYDVWMMSLNVDQNWISFAVMFFQLLEWVPSIVHSSSGGGPDEFQKTYRRMKLMEQLLQKQKELLETPVCKLKSYLLGLGVYFIFLLICDVIFCHKDAI